MRFAFNPLGRWLATEHEDHSVRLWDLNGGPDFPSWIVGIDNAKVTALAFTPDGERLYFGGVLLDMTLPPEKIRQSGRSIDDSRQFSEWPQFSPDAHWLFNFTGTPVNTQRFLPQARSVGLEQ